MKIALATTYDVQRPEYWPKYYTGNWGATIFITKSLMNHGVEIEFLGPLPEGNWFLTRGKRAFYRYIQRKDYHVWSDPLVCKNYGDQASRKLENLDDVELVLCTEVFAISAYLETKLPIVIWIDTPLVGLFGVYAYLSNLCDETAKDIFKLEKRALEKASLIIVTSDWAKSVIMDLYNIANNKIEIITRGANLEIIPDRSLQDIQLLINQRNKKVCRLIFSGVEWARKGGDVAIKVVEELNRMGLPTELVVIGCDPEIEKPYPSFVKVYGYINKSTKEGREKIIDLIASSHFLILPTKADTNPHVLTEANAFGVPCLATNMMGISTVIKNGVNGQTFSPNSSIDEYCQFIMQYFSNYTEYENLATNTFNEYLYRLSWDVAGRRAVSMFDDLLKVIQIR